jgi:hypothetical protein
VLVEVRPILCSAQILQKGFDGTRAFEQVIGVKSIEQAFEIQTQYAKNAYDTYMAEMPKLGEIYIGLARNAYKPVEQAVAKAAKKAA